jgi:hypothetical protein
MGGEGGHAVAQFGFRHCATSREVAGSIPDGIVAIFHLLISSGRSMALGSNNTLNGNK